MIKDIINQNTFCRAEVSLVVKPVAPVTGLYLEMTEQKSVPIITTYV